MDKSRVRKEEQLRKNGWYEVDILDMRILSYVSDNDVSRRNVKEKFGITEEKSRSRLEKLVDKDIINKKIICRSCGKRISECECGKYSKQIIYSRDPEKDMIEIKFLIDEMEDILNL